MKFFSTLRVKLFIWLSSLIIIFVLFSLVMNTQFLRPYYMMKQKKQHIEISDRLSELYSEDYNDFLLEIERLERVGGYRVFLFNHSGMVLFDSTLSENNPPLKPPPPPKMKPPVDNLPFILERIRTDSIGRGKYIFQEIHDQRLNINLLDMYTVYGPDQILLLSGPIDSMKESVAIASNFFMFTGAVTVIIGSIAAFLFAARFTKPIIDLKAIAVSMSNLDFSHKYRVETRDEVGELGSSINSLSDQLHAAISSLRTANSRLQEDIEKEREIDEMRKEFISNVSHELKTPISLIQGYAEGLKQDVVEDGENKLYYCDVIIDEALKMDKHVRELLELSQMESGVFSIDCTKFDLSELITDIEKKHDKAFREKQIDLKIVFNQELYVYADRLRIEQVVINYLTNALNHVSTSGKLIISTTTTIENKTRLHIFNTGKPIPEADKSKIWDSYYKIDKARTRAYGGSGLGLSIVRAIQNKHGNRYGVENLKDGVSFWIDLTRA